MLRVTGLCAGNSPEAGEFPAQMASNAKMFPFDDVIISKSMLVLLRKRPQVNKSAPGRADNILMTPMVNHPWASTD